MRKNKKDRKKQRRRQEHQFFASTKAWDLFEEAEEAIEEEDSSRAIRLLTQATKTDPEFIPPYIYLGFLYNKEQKPDLALRFLWEAQRKDPQNPAVYRYLGDSYFFLDRIEEAEDCSKKIISLFKGKRNLSPPEKQIKEDAKQSLKVYKTIKEEKAKQIAELVRQEHLNQKQSPSLHKKAPGDKQSESEEEDSLALQKLLDGLNVSQKIVFKENEELVGALQRKNYQPFDLYQLKEEAAGLSLLKGFDHLLCLNEIRGVKKFWYQIETVRKTLKYFRGRVLLCDEVGLGKTVEAGMILKEYLIRGMVRKVLILTPPSLVAQWKDEMESKFNLRFTSTDDPDYKKQGKLFWKNNTRIIASLHIAKSRKNFDAASCIDYDMVIVDEAHHLKNRRTLNWKFVNSLKKKFILLLTATPVQNNLIELYNLITILKPGHLKTSSSFRKSFVAKGDPRIPENREKLRELLSQVMIRNTRSLANINLPKRYAGTIKLKWSEEEEKFYHLLSDFVREAYLSRGLDKFTCTLLQMEAGSSPQAAGSTLMNLMKKDRVPKFIQDKAQEIIHHSRISTSRKAKELIEILNKNEEKIIVFTNYIITQRFLSNILKEEGIPFATFSGNLSSEQKKKSIDLFQKEVKVLLSSEIGGEGRNLHFCNTMVNYDLPWNPMRIEQRVGRIHRIGQKRDVFIFNLCAQGTVEDYLLEILDKKINMFELVIGEMDAILGNLDEKKDFSEVVMDIWMRKNREQEFKKLGEQLVRAKQRYLEVKKYEDEVFQHDYEL